MINYRLLEWQGKVIVNRSVVFAAEDGIKHPTAVKMTRLNNAGESEPSNN